MSKNCSIFQTSPTRETERLAGLESCFPIRGPLWCGRLWMGTRRTDKLVVGMAIPTTWARAKVGSFERASSNSPTAWSAFQAGFEFGIQLDGRGPGARAARWVLSNVGPEVGLGLGVDHRVHNHAQLLGACSGVYQVDDDGIAGEIHCRAKAESGGIRDRPIWGHGEHGVYAKSWYSLFGAEPGNGPRGDALNTIRCRRAAVGHRRKTPTSAPGHFNQSPRVLGRSGVHRKPRSARSDHATCKGFLCLTRHAESQRAGNGAMSGTSSRFEVERSQGEAIATSLTTFLSRSGESRRFPCPKVWPRG